MSEIDQEATAPTAETPQNGADFQAQGEPATQAAASDVEGKPAEDKPAEAVTAAVPPDAAKPAAPAANNSESLIETVKTIVYALLIALVIRTFLFQPFNIPSGSMEATLLIGDYLFVEKFAYGYSRYSFPFGLGPIPGRILEGSGPKRGDVIVFKLPRDNSTDYIKRLIGLPGDRIQVIDGQLYINEKPVPRVRVSDYVEDDALGNTQRWARFRETLPGGKSYFVLARPTGASPCGVDGAMLDVNNTSVYTVPPGHYFMMGDNRDNSSDSRVPADGPCGGVGYVPAPNLVGKAEFIFFSNDGPLWEFWRWPWSVRFSRMFTTID